MHDRSTPFIDEPGHDGTEEKGKVDLHTTGREKGFRSLDTY
jgi:hypothetical protein